MLESSLPCVNACATAYWNIKLGPHYTPKMLCCLVLCSQLTFRSLYNVLQTALDLLKDRVQGFRAQTRMIIHFADAPCHGSQYHSMRDDYPGGDPHGEQLHAPLLPLCRRLAHVCSVSNMQALVAYLLWASRDFLPAGTVTVAFIVRTVMHSDLWVVLFSKCCYIWSQWVEHICSKMQVSILRRCCGSWLPRMWTTTFWRSSPKTPQR